MIQKVREGLDTVLSISASNIAYMSAGFLARSRDSYRWEGGGRRGEAPGHFRSKGATSRHVKTRPNSSHCHDQVNICSNCLEQSHDHKNLTRNKCNESVITILAISILYNRSVDCRTADVALWLNCACL